MNFDLQKELVSASNSPDKRVVCVSFSPDSERLAVVTADHSVTFFTLSNGETSKISIKGRDSDAKRNFTITDFDWAPDSQRFVVSQTDLTVAVYDIGPANASGYKKKIAMRTVPKSAPLCVKWPRTSQNDFVYGLLDGAVFFGFTKMKKAEEIYRHSSPAALISNPTSKHTNSCVVAHMDGNIFVVNLDNNARTVAYKSNGMPLALAWGSQILTAGSDLLIHFANPNGDSLSNVDFSNQKELRSFSSATFDPSGQTAIVGAKDALFTFNYSQRVQSWTQSAKVQFDGVYSIPSLSWSSDGSRIAVASVTGSVLLLSCSLGSYKYKNLFEVINVTGSQLKIVDLSTKKEVNMKSDYRIINTNFQNNRYAVVRTTQSYIIGDTKSGKVSEIPTTLYEGDEANFTMKEKFIFVDDIAILMWNAGELLVMEFGKQGTPLASISTQYASSYLLSINFSKKRKILAYLVDAKTVNIIDCATQVSIGNIKVNNKIDWLELNVAGSMLLFRDSKRSLFLYNIVTGQTSGLINLCSYAQWVPQANVIVCQTRNNMYVYYSPSSPEDCFTDEIQGDIVDIVRNGTKTTVTIQNGQNVINYPLDGTYIAFSAAMEASDIKKAAEILVCIKSNDKSASNVTSLWTELSKAALDKQDYTIAEVCYGKMGDICRARFLHKINKLIDQFGLQSYQVQSQLAMLQGNFKQAEFCLSEHEKLDEVADMYKMMHMWNELLDFIELRSPNKLSETKEVYFKYLIDTQQYQHAAELKMKEGKPNDAVQIALDANKPVLAAEILIKDNGVQPQLIEVVIEQLAKQKKGLDYAGQLSEKLGKSDDALKYYRASHNYFKALECAQNMKPEEVVEIHREWAKYCSTETHDNESACAHYVEAGDYKEAVFCAVQGQLWLKAAEILRSITSSIDLRDQLKTQILRVARYFGNSANSKNQAEYISIAEDLFLSVEAHKDIVEMYLSNGRIQDAMKHGKRFLKTPKGKQSELETICMNVAKRLSKKEDTRSIAEQIYVEIGKPELAIDMYTQYNDTDSVSRLSSKVNIGKDKLEQMGSKAEKEGNFELAEDSYIRAGQWKKAVFMYRHEKMWEDAQRVCRQCGTKDDELQIDVHWARDIGGQAGVQKLVSLGVVEDALLYCCDNSMTEMAQTIIANCKTLKNDTVNRAHLKIALCLESQSNFPAAEKFYLMAGQPREAIEMYTHNDMYNEAMRVARANGITDVQIQKSHSSPSKSSEQIGTLKEAMSLEKQGDYAAAINKYLSLTIDECGNKSRLIQIYERTVQLAMKYASSMLSSVVTTVAKNMIEMNEYESLGAILEKIAAYSDAVEIYKLGNLWDNAKRLVQYLESADQEQFWKDYQKFLQSNQDVDKMVNIGAIEDALDVLAEQGKWEECITKAQDYGNQYYISKYTLLYAQDLLISSKYDEAISILSQFQPSIDEKSQNSTSNLCSFITLCEKAIPSLPSYETLRPSFYELRDVMFKALPFLKSNKSIFDKFKHLTEAVHILCQIDSFENTKDQAMIALAGKASLSLIRYVDVIPCDYVFYKAGSLMEMLKNDAAAIVFYGRLADIFDAINANRPEDVKALDNSAFDTSVPQPSAYFLRKKTFIQQRFVDRVSEWVLDKTVSSSVEGKVPKIMCEKCGRQIFAGALVCPFCQANYEYCSVTGSPIIDASHASKCTSCNRKANKADWTTYIKANGKCPICHTKQIIGN